MSSPKAFKAIPTVASVDAALHRVAARLVNLEVELSGGNPDGQLSKLWESVEELNLRVLFIMNTLQMTMTLSPIADASGKIPTKKMTALEAYMHYGGREKLVAGLEAQEKAARDAAAFSERRNESLPTEEQGHAEDADKGRNGTPCADPADPGASTLVDNPSRFSKQ